jgi:hypothetical protein
MVVFVYMKNVFVIKKSPKYDFFDWKIESIYFLL